MHHTRTLTAPARAALAAVVALAACSPDSSDAPVAVASGYEAVVEEMRTLVRHEMEAKGLPAVGVALVDGDQLVWAQAFGEADPGAGTPATTSTVWRVGSVSKLFTDLAVMQLVERGELDLDAPVTTYLPDFQPENPFGTAVTLRQLMAHRSGLVREPPVGNYFDPTEPTLEATVASLNETALVYAPETRTKYSNAAIATVGRVLEVTQGAPFAEYVQGAVLDPLGMHDTAFEPRPELAAALAKARMWTVDGRTSEAPTFELGMAPAGSMYTTLPDLGRFMSALFAGGAGVNGQVLGRETLEAMWTPQFTAEGAATGFGIGFALSELEGHRRIGHGGAIYGFATELQALPDRGLGVVVVTSLDIANTVTERLADAALRLMLAASEGEPLPALRRTGEVPDAVVDAVVGDYRQGERWLTLAERAGGLALFREGIPMTVRALGGDTLVVDDALSYGPVVVPVGDAVEIGGERWEPFTPARPADVPERWRGLIGEYGWDHNTLYVLERDGRLHALIEWFFTYPLEEISENEFRFPARGLYDGESLVFTRGANGQATRVEAASVVFERRNVGLAEGETFRIDPVRPVDELAAEALAAEPPTETGEFRDPDLVDLSTVDPTIRFDIRYASTNNFMSSVFYQLEKAFLQRPAAEAVGRAHRALAEQGYGVMIHDAYRPWYVTKMFWDATPEDMKIFVADPSQGSRHNRGAAVDLSLMVLESGEVAHAVGGYDEFSPRSYPDYPGGTALQRWHRELLRDAMEAEGFTVYEAEWWHFDYDDWRAYPIQNLTFEEILAGR